MTDMKAVDMDTKSWECFAAGTKWRSAPKQHLKTEEDKLLTGVEGSNSVRPETHINVISSTKTITPHLSFQPQSMLLHPRKTLINKIQTKRIMIN